MSRKTPKSPVQPLSSLRRRNEWWILPAAFMATLLALPVNAGITIPDEPLTTGNRVAPNILFILDDSGSMAWRYMYSQTVTSVTGTGVNSTKTGNNTGSDSTYGSDSTNVNALYDQNYVTNSLYYNPAVTYYPWMGPDGNRLTGGTSYTAAYSSDTWVTNAGAGTNGGSENLSSNTQTFYVPQNVNSTNPVYLSSVNNYYRYQITSGGSDVQRGVYGTAVIVNTTPPDSRPPGYPQNATNTGGTNSLTSYSFTVPSGLASMVVTTTGGDHGSNGPNWTNGNGDGADLYVDDDSNVLSGAVCTDAGSDNNESCTINTPAGGTWYVGLVNASRYKNVALNVVFKYQYSYTSNRCDGSDVAGSTWIDCVSATPTGRTVDAEKTNFATWHSYYRTRTKAAKQGASEAFKSLGNKVRVGYRTIWDRSNFDIPVTDGNDGRFVDNTDDPTTIANEATTSRTTWYRRLYAATASNGTPLQNALDGAGIYFSGTSPTGPYGPQATASQYSCRQNFTILTTDGYWNTSTVDVGNNDNSSGSTITGPKNDPYTYSPVNPYKDSYTKTLADIAMKYWKTDLRTLTNNVPTTTANPAFWQHMVTFALSIGLSGKKGWQSVADVAAIPNWADPTDVEDADRIDDLLHAAVNGRGSFVSAASPSEFTTGLTQALAAIQQRTSSYSNVATSSTSLNTGAQVFSASYTSGLWTGSVTARAVTRSGISSTLTWTASIPTWSTRKIYTSTGTSGATFPTAGQQSALARTGGPADYAPITGAENANYIKGDQSKEESNPGGLLRNRTTLLGDIVGSSPAYVKDTGTLYVGANDGMMHAFDATNGQELFAYVPNILNFNYLSTLSRGDYTHKFFVDGPIVVSNRALTANKNVLVGALGKGGKGLYALDVSTPASFGAGSFLWERSETGSGATAHMGLVQGAPILAAVRSGGSTNAVVLGNGVNSANDKAVLIVLNLETGAIISQIDTGVGSSSAPNALSAPTGVYAADGKTLIYAYAGDMLGNVWKFDLTSSSPASWTATAIFNATKAGVAQPITSGVTVATDPVTRKRWVFFGTGRFMTTTDADDKTASAQSMYGFIDENQTTAYGRGDLTARGVTVSGSARYFDDKAPLAATSKGWYVDLPGAGERIVQDAQIASTFLITASMIPEGDACDASGTGYINAIDAFTGTSGGTSFFDLDKNGSTDDTGAGGKPVGSINLGVGMPTKPILLPGQIVAGGTGDGTAADPKGTYAGGMQWGRVSWREVRKD